MYICINNVLYACCSFVGLDNKLYKLHGTVIKIGNEQLRW